MRALIVASSREELSAFQDDRYIKVVTGTGLCLAAIETVRSIIEYSPDIVINVGSAGCLNGRHKIGSVISFKEVYNRDQDLTSYHLPPYSTLNKDGSTLGPVSLLGKENTLISSSAFTVTPDASADAADMECYAVALAAERMGRKTASFKLITDIVGEKPLISDYRRILREGRLLLEGEVRKFLDSL